ncbi:MAG: hypothetical protein AMS23_11365 [Bacteroides sp. SM1_62]|nr:MAG: hypothetical protein AMS26_00300 [Bacteroides sp. SM23_62]KPL20219.1 MAG: hypothetical protein AMS23_11365 [Bacteroides sp. SM1_62]
MQKYCLYIFLILSSSLTVTGQEKSPSFELKGYLSNMQSAMFEDPSEDWIIDNLFHNRLNFFWYGGQHFNASIQFRNRLMYGETLKLIPGYIDNVGKEDGLFDLSFNLLSGESYVLNSTIDRIWFQYTTEGFSSTLGRQRINWGQTFVWNVNDVFNVYSYFDFDYEERPGSDAVRLQFYPNYTSTIELAVKIDSAHKVTAAARYRFNVFSYDIQLLAGILSEEDYLGGIGWSGNIGGAGFRGEASYFHPKYNFRDTSGMFMSSVGIDYTFPNTLMLQGEYLYSSKPYTSLYGILDYYSGPLTVKQLAFTEHTIFASGSYQITPLFYASLSGMYFPKMKGYFIGPNLSYNILSNLDLACFLQYFNVEQESPITGSKSRQRITLWFLRLKWSF